MNGNISSNSCDIHDFKIPVFTSVYSVVLVVGLAGNGTALYVFVCLTRRKTANTIFMINLAISDLFFNLTLPYRIAYYRLNEWTLGTFLCRISSYAFYLNLYSSILFLTTLSAFRYIAIVHPVRAKSLLTVRRALAVCLAIWLFVGLATAPFLLATPHWHRGRLLCFEPHNMNWKVLLRLNYMALVPGFILPFGTILVCYAGIMRRLCWPTQRLHRSARSSRRPICMVFIVLSSFLFCFLPYHIIRTVHLHLMSQDRHCRPFTLAVQKAIVVTLCLAASNSCLNPLLYYFVGENFRKTIKKSGIFRAVKSTTFCTESAAVPEAPEPNGARCLALASVSTQSAP
ncbi:cysteinyl leukotriene receptor 1-like [Hypanus sabinus]|uniref:cysteinyl leukotriene receptor 1-like n=1 Tax=Hypanus sabinus TaxID=79690 RepID=UPI0028C3D0AB|nr:cysteinyl leukotriene receptor 1-like [Hypanus sabinus]